MATADDVAAYILEQAGSMTAMKMQKLAYYSHAWHLVWDNQPLFTDRIEAWANGPVVRALYRKHRGQFVVDRWPAGDPTRLTEDERNSIDAVLAHYAAMSAHQLSELTHSEAPWREARGDLPIGARCEVEITDAAMYEYYDGLTHAQQS